MIAYAYRGDKMSLCVKRYLKSLAGVLKDSLEVKDKKLPLRENTDMLVFNGHNELMNSYENYVENIDNIKKDAVIIACISYDYFKPYLSYAKGYPFVTTTNLLAPEAYILEAIVDSWASMQSGQEICFSAGDAYDKYHKCSQKAAKALFRTGFDK